MAEKVYFVPFDSRSDAHAERMYLQRVACGWGDGDVETWRGHCDEGKKAIWWLVSVQPRFPGSHVHEGLLGPIGAR